MPPKEIPGFYYDECKKKYFKILPNHAVPQGARNSSESIRKRIGDETSRKRAEAFKERVFKQRTQRSKILGHPLFGNVGLTRERGTACSLGDASAIAWTCGLERTVTFDFKDRSATSLTYDAATGTYVFGFGPDPNYGDTDIATM